MTRIDVIQAIIDRTKAKTYLEIGVANGNTFKQIKAKNLIGVDPVKSEKLIGSITQMMDENKTPHFFEMTSDEFFEAFKMKVFKFLPLDVVFIDGLHEFHQVVRDVLNVLKYLSEDGIIIIHDCNPTQREWQFTKKVTREWCGDVWKAIPFFRRLLRKQIFVLDMDYGLEIIAPPNPDVPTNLPSRSTPAYNLTYEQLDLNRKYLLNLVPPGQFTPFIAQM